MTVNPPQTNRPDAAWFKALGSPLRLDILRVVHQRGIASPKELAEFFGITISRATYHTRVLESVCLVEETHQLSRRGAVEHFFRVLLGASLGAQDLHLLPPSIRRSGLVNGAEAFFHKLVAALEYNSIEGDEDAVLRWLPVTVADADGRRRIAAILHGAQIEIEKVSDEAIERLAKSEGEPDAAIPLVVGFASFRSAPLIATPTPI